MFFVLGAVSLQILGSYFCTKLFGGEKDTIRKNSFSKKFFDSAYLQNTIRKSLFSKKIFDSKTNALYTYRLIQTYFPIRVCACVCMWQKNRSILVDKCL